MITKSASDLLLIIREASSFLEKLEFTTTFDVVPSEEKHDMSADGLLFVIERLGQASNQEEERATCLLMMSSRLAVLTSAHCHC